MGLGPGRLEHGLRRAARAAAVVVVLVVVGAVATGCGSSADNAGASGTPVLGFMSWRDNTGTYDDIIARCNQAAKGRYKVVSKTMGPTTDAGREQLTRRLGAGDSTIDIVNLDVIWTAEFADAGWIVDMTDRLEPIIDQYIPAAVDSVTYDDKLWAVPVGANTALLYYRSDIVEQAPKTWEDVVAAVKKYKPAHPDMDGVIFQGMSYEGGTVDALEFVYGAGGEILSPDSSKAVVTDNDGAERAFTLLRDMMRDKIAPQAVKTFQEEDTRLAFQNGTALFMRNWPYAFSNMTEDPASRVKGKFKVAPLPGIGGHAPAAVMGGQNYGITTTSKHPELAWEAISCLGNEQAQIEKATLKGELPVLTALYSNAAIKKALPFIDQSFAGLKTARNRPKSPMYNDITTAIHKAYNEVLAGRLSPKAAAKRIDGSVQRALDGEADI